jgi:aldehyde dehydrogenase (NAD+)
MSINLTTVHDEMGIRPGRLFIDGKWLSWDGERFDQINPTSNQVMTSFPIADQSGVDLAVAAARKAFDVGPWPKMPALDRKSIIRPIVEAMYAASDDLHGLQCLDNGMPYRLSCNSRISARAAADIFDHYAGWIDKINGETYPVFSSASNMQYMSFREPVGVVGAILPYNAPLFTFAIKVGAALACGCTIVVKPSEYTNLAVTRIAEILSESDLPAGVFNLVTGGGETGAALAGHPGIDKITATCSPQVGEKIFSAGASTMKRLSLELGGKSAGIVFSDARRVQTAATTLMGLCSTFLSGQICTTPSRAIVHRSILDEFIHHAKEQVSAVRFGDPFHPDTTSAPIISKLQMQKIQKLIESGQREGATLVFGGDKPGGALESGNWINPALFVCPDNKVCVAREEIFGPVLTVIPFDTEEEAIKIANDSDYGLAGCVYTTDISRAFRVARAVRSGSIGINNYASVPNAPMGGIKRSGVGREGGWQTIEAFTELKTININLDA